MLKFEDCISSKPIDESFAASILNSSVDLLSRIVKLWNGLPSTSEIVNIVAKQLLPKLDTKSYHPDLERKISQLGEILAQINPSRSHIVPQRKKEIKMLRLYDPELDDKWVYK